MVKSIFRVTLSLDLLLGACTNLRLIRNVVQSFHPILLTYIGILDRFEGPAAEIRDDFPIPVAQFE